MAWTGTKANSPTFRVPVSAFLDHTVYSDSKNLPSWFPVNVFASQDSHNSILFSCPVKFLRDTLHLYISLFISVTTCLCVLMSLRISIMTHLTRRTSQVTSCIALHSHARLVLEAERLSWCSNRIFCTDCSNCIHFGQLKAYHLLHSNWVPPEEQIQSFI